MPDALLADLQNSINPNGRVGSPGGRTVSPGRLSSPAGSLGSPTSTGYGSINGSRNISSDYAKPVSPTYQNTSSFEKLAPPALGSPGYGRAGGGAGAGRGLSELDSLLDDLSHARYHRHAHHDGARSPGAGGGPARPSVDALLDQLSADLPNGRGGAPAPGGSLPRPGTRQVTVTVQETVVEPAPAPAPAPARLHASSATKELDDLMASLEDFKVGSSGPPAPAQPLLRSAHAWQDSSRAARPEPASLDHMLGSLRADMSRQGVQTPQKGCCNACEKPIVGQVITALGRTWHPEHFTCAHCTQELGTRNFFERDGRPYCEPDYHNLFSPRCAYCNGPILDKCVTALEKTWHTEHFFCAQCGQQFGEDGFHERDGKPYCRADYFDMFAPKCGGCAKPIMENYISALNSQWHPDCFVCKDCQNPVKGKSFYAMEGKPVCPQCVGVDEDE